jgi:ankyrin repeat protein
MNVAKVFAWTCCFFVSFIVFEAWPDGGFVGKSGPEAVSTDQRAIIIKNGSKISMTISPGYSGDGEDFGWIVPVPAPPAVEDVSEGGGEAAFELVDAASAPIYIEKPVLKCEECSDSEPLLSTYRQMKLEHFEVSVVGAGDSPALFSWLQRHGYQITPAVTDVLKTYVKKKWAFVVARLDPEKKRRYENEFLPSLSFKYRGDRLIYPILLSAAGKTRTINVTLYVIAESTASALNYPTPVLKYAQSLSGQVDCRKYIEACIRRTLAGRDCGLVVMQAGQFGRGVEGGNLIEEMAELPFPNDQKMYLTRLEARMEPTAITEDIELGLDPRPTAFRIVLKNNKLEISELRVAAHQGELDRVRRLSKVLDVDERDINGDTALIEAVGHRYEEVVPILLRAGADVNAQNRHGYTALMAARFCDADIVSMLLEAGAGVGVRENDLGRTALMLHALNQKPEVISLLLNAGADVNARDTHRSETVLMFAAEQNRNPGVISLLLDFGADVSARDEWLGQTVLMHAAEYNPKTEVISTLLEAGAGVNDATPSGTTALMIASAKNANPDVVSTLLAAGADVNTRQWDGKTALMEAVGSYYPHKVDLQIVKRLLDAGADVNLRDREGGTALIYAVGVNRNPIVISMLLDSGAEVNVQNNEGSTALMVGAGDFWYNPEFNSELILLLLQAGADAKLVDNEGKTAFDYARSHLRYMPELQRSDAYQRLREATDRR